MAPLVTLSFLPNLILLISEFFTVIISPPKALLSLRTYMAEVSTECKTFQLVLSE